MILYIHLLVEERKLLGIAWKLFPEVTAVFNDLLSMPSEVSEGSVLLLEKFVVLIYDRTSESTNVKDAR